MDVNKVDLAFSCVWDNPSKECTLDISDEGIQACAERNAASLFRNLYKCEQVSTEICAPIFNVPEPVVLLPRIRPLPKPKPLTRWEKFAKEKGIGNKKKKDPLVWDDDVQEWRPRFGFKRKGNVSDQWVVDTPHDYVPGKGQDPFVEMKNKVKERKDSNELKRLQNISRKHTVGKASADVYNNKVDLHKKVVEQKLRQIHHSTASAGRYQSNVKKGKKIKTSAIRHGGVFASNTDHIKEEPDHALSILKKVMAKTKKSHY